MRTCPYTLSPLRKAFQILHKNTFGDDFHRQSVPPDGGSKICGVCMAGKNISTREEFREYQQKKNQKRSAEERAFEKIDIVHELKVLAHMIKELKIDYEQFFLGLMPHEPTKLHKELKKQIRKLRKAPFKKSRHRFRMLSLERRYHVYNDYWQRIMREKEAGTYSKDVFKANMRERHAKEDREALSERGQVRKGFENLLDSYKRALEQQTGKKQQINAQKFQESIMKKAKAFQKQHGKKKLNFSVVVKDGKVSIKARAKE